MSLKIKLFIVMASTIILALFISGFVYYLNIQDMFKKQVEQSIDYDVKILNAYITKTKNNLDELSKKVASDELVLSVLNLISKYEDPKNYSKETFDYEKLNLLEHTDIWLEATSNVSIKIYDEDKNLVLINRKYKGKEAFGISSYSKEGEKIFISADTQKEEKFPNIKELEKDIEDGFFSIALPKAFVLSKTTSVRFGNELIGYVNICYSFNENDAKILQNELVNPTVFISNDKTYIAADKNLNAFNFKDQRYIIKSTPLYASKNTLTAVSIVDKVILQNSLTTTFVEMIIVSLVIVAVTFVLAYLFGKEFVIESLERLKNAFTFVERR